MTRAGVTPFCIAMSDPRYHTSPSQPSDVELGASATRITAFVARSTRSKPCE